MSSSISLPADASLNQLLQAAVASESPEIANLRLQRVFPVIICADAAADDGTPDHVGAMEIADELLSEIKSVLEADCELLGEFGPFDGSRQWSLFYRTKEPVDERDFKARVRATADAVKAKLVGVAKKTGPAVKVGAAVGKIAAIVVGGSVMATTLHIPVVVWVVILGSGEVATIAENTKRLFFE
jgi:hypothetical protein